MTAEGGPWRDDGENVEVEGGARSAGEEEGLPQGVQCAESVVWCAGGAWREREFHVGRRVWMIDVIARKFFKLVVVLWTRRSTAANVSPGQADDQLEPLKTLIILVPCFTAGAGVPTRYVDMAVNGSEAIIFGPQKAAGQDLVEQSLTHPLVVQMPSALTCS